MLEADAEVQLQQSNGAADREALDASRKRLKQEARQALVKAGQLFKEVVLVSHHADSYVCLVSWHAGSCHLCPWLW